MEANELPKSPADTSDKEKTDGAKKPLNPPQTPEELETLHQSIYSYPFVCDEVFVRAYERMLQDADRKISDEEIQLYAKCFYWQRKHNVKVDHKAYREYETRQDEKLAKNFLKLAVGDEAAGDSKDPAAQSTKPLETAGSDPDLEPPNTSKEAGPPSKETPYPQSFQDIVEIITSGRSNEIPVKQIAPTILADKTTAPKVQARKKPWETNDRYLEATKEGTFGKPIMHIKQEIPD